MKASRFSLGKVCLAALILLLLSAPAALETASVQLEILSPTERDCWELNRTVTIHWKASDVGGRLAVELFRNRNRVALISGSAPVDAGMLQWTVAGKDIVPGAGYQVRFTTLADRKSYVSQSFSVSEDFKPATLSRYAPARLTPSLKRAGDARPVTMKVLSPRKGDRWGVLQRHVVKWESEGLARDDDVGIALVPVEEGPFLAKIIDIVKNTGEYIYWVPYPRIFMNVDVRVCVTPLKDRSVEAFSEPFMIMGPLVELIAGDLSYSTREPRRRPRKWWEHVGDIFTGGVTWYVNEVAEASRLSSEGTTMDIDVHVVNRGLLTQKDVDVDCSVLTSWGNVLYFSRHTIPVLSPDRPVPVAFSAKTRDMNLEKGRHIIEILIDPEHRTREEEPFRGNNRVTVEFEVK